jgi:hypothetical protein
VAQGYWGNPQDTERDFRACPSGEEGAAARFLRTGDLGFVSGGELYVTGRLKDLVILRGRNHYPQDIEQTVEGSHQDLRPAGGAAFSVDVEGEERLVVVWEVDRRATDRLQGIGEAIRRAVSEAHEAQVYETLLLRVGTVPKTTSGKIQRHACRAGYLAGTLTEVGRCGLERSGAARASAEDEAVAASLAALGLRPEVLRVLPPAERLAALVDGLRPELSYFVGVPTSAISGDESLERWQGAAERMRSVLEKRLRIAFGPAEAPAGENLSSLARQALAEWDRSAEL